MLKPTTYPAYKPSGVEWLGDIPAHWEQLPGRACYYEKKSPNTGMQETTVLSLSYGQIVVKPVEQHHGLVPASFETYQVIEPGDIIIRPTDLQNDWTSLRFGLSRHHGAITSAYMCFRTRAIISREYGHLLLHTYDLKKIFYGLGSGLRQNLNWRDFQYLPCLVPPLPEQTAIVRYLNHATELIDRYISAKERLINLLEEQRQAVIQRTVTWGLDPDVRLKPSGVEWLGDVPAHWEIRRLKTICSMKSGDSITGMTIEPVGEYPVYGGNGIRGYTSDYTNDGNFVLIGRQGALCGNIHVVRGRFWASEHAVIASLHPYHDLDWFGFILTVMNLNQYSISAAQPGLAVERILNIALPVPSLRDQFAIAEYLHKTTADIDAAIDRAHQEIELLKEYRTRVVADVVTGKLDVREAALKLPEMTDELSIIDKPELQPG